MARRVIRYMSFTPRPGLPALPVPGPLRKVLHFEQFGQIEVMVVLAGGFVVPGSLQHSPSMLQSAEFSPKASCSPIMIWPVLT